MPSTRKTNVSMKLDFMDTYLEHVRGMDMNGQNQPAWNNHTAISANIKELGYGGQ